MFEEADLIHVYTRADALRDGVLIDVSQTAREAGFKSPAALTRAARRDLARTKPAGCRTCRVAEKCDSFTESTESDTEAGKSIAASRLTPGVTRLPGLEE
jgi:hypothetical protein